MFGKKTVLAAIFACALVAVPTTYAATILKLSGKQFIHGYMNHRFGTNRKTHQLVAQARQFSAFILVIGTMTDGSTLDPKDAIIVQNKVCFNLSHTLSFLGL